MNVLAIVVKENKILIGKLLANKISDFGGIQYVFPGGKVEQNETPEQAVIREVEEETGIKVKVIKKIAERIHPKTGKEIQYFYCEYIDGEIDITGNKNDDIEEILFIEIGELKKYMPTIFEPVLSFLLEILSK